MKPLAEFACTMKDGRRDRRNGGGALQIVLTVLATLAVVAVAAIWFLGSKVDRQASPQAVNSDAAPERSMPPRSNIPPYFYASGKLLPEAFLNSDFTVNGQKFQEKRFPVRRFLEIFFELQLANGKSREFKGWRIEDNEYTLRFASGETIDRVTFTRVMSPPANGTVAWLSIAGAQPFETIQYVLLNIKTYAEANPGLNWDGPLPIEARMTGQVPLQRVTPPTVSATPPATLPAAAQTPANAQVAQTTAASPDGEINGDVVRTRFGSVATKHDGTNAYLQLNGAKVVGSENPTDYGLHSKFSMNEHDVLLLSNAVGASCTMFTFLTISSAQSAAFSVPFGTCDDGPAVEKRGTSVVVRMTARDRSTVNYVFKEGVVFENGKLMR